MSQTEVSIPAEWVSTIAQAIHDADEADAPARAIAKIVITILRPLIEAETRAELARKGAALRKLALARVERRTYEGGFVQTGWCCKVCDCEWKSMADEHHQPTCALIATPQPTEVAGS